MLPSANKKREVPHAERVYFNFLIFKKSVSVYPVHLGKVLNIYAVSIHPYINAVRILAT